MKASQAEVRGLLTERFGHESFRPGQERVIRDLLGGRDVLAVMPTGGGKSLIYQLTAQLLPGATIVVSPLIALMHDQVESLEDQGVEVGFVNSTLTEAQSEEEMREVEEAEAKLLYVTPERFGNEEFMADLQDMRVSLFVVDEAHSVSEWGHDFRPSYLTLGSVAEQLGRPPILALTATATPWVRREIVERLRMKDPDIVVRGTDRPNLFLEVLRVEEDFEDRRMLERLLTGYDDHYPPELSEKLQAAMQGTGIIYTATTKAAEETAEWLREWGIPADYYHGQRKKGDRERVQEEFMEGRLRVIVATNAFGMGVDKPDVRFMIHRDIPGNVESYYQEAGRAGRDGEFARCTIIYRPQNLGRAAFMSGSGRLSREDVERARPGLLAHPEASPQELEEITGLSKGDLARLIAVLQRGNIVEEVEGRVRLLVSDFDPEQVSLDQEDYRQAYERSRLEMMRGYAELDECRRHYILNYFGEEYEPGRCDMCDVDATTDGRSRADEAEREAGPLPFGMGDNVVHAKWGEGTVQRITEDKVTVLFEKAGYKTLATDLVQEQGLLRPESE